MPMIKANKNLLNKELFKYLFSDGSSLPERYDFVVVYLLGFPGYFVSGFWPGVQNFKIFNAVKAYLRIGGNRLWFRPPLAHNKLIRVNEYLFIFKDMFKAVSPLNRYRLVKICNSNRIYT